ncbi:hypothetical protein niasHT_030179 [Heterodera trifolii]|uniref:carbonic anhydrase n=1 Tax=Heterodera trifolii TaxID=157864 RepID=A0ABD2K2S4_9BILA
MSDHSSIGRDEDGRSSNKKQRTEPERDEEQTEAVARSLTVKDWDYDEGGQRGPKHWLKLPKGRIWSPIDLKLSDFRSLTTDTPLCLVNYKMPLSGKLINTGRGIKFQPNTTVLYPLIHGGMLDQPYRFVQYHLHWTQRDAEGAEHTLNGFHCQAELHIVHEGVEDSSKLAVLGIFLELDTELETDEPSLFSADEMEVLKNVVEYQQNSVITTTLATKLPPNCCTEDSGDSSVDKFESSFVRYAGSLTTPPCSEIVTWTVFTDPVLITQKQMSLLRAVKDCEGKVILKNYRPSSKLSPKRVFELSYLWGRKYGTLDDVEQETGIGRPTIVDWFNFNRDICAEFFVRNLRFILANKC